MLQTGGGNHCARTAQPFNGKSCTKGRTVNCAAAAAGAARLVVCDNDSSVQPPTSNGKFAYDLLQMGMHLKATGKLAGKWSANEQAVPVPPGHSLDREQAAVTTSGQWIVDWMAAWLPGCFVFECHLNNYRALVSQLAACRWWWCWW